MTSCLDLLEEGNRRSGTYKLTFGEENKVKYKGSDRERERNRNININIVIIM